MPFSPGQSALSRLRLMWVLALTLWCSTAVSQTQAEQQAVKPAPPDSRAEESMIAYAQGSALLKSGKVEQAIEKLKNAVVLKPDDGNYRYRLAMAYERLGKWSNTWFQLRQAVRLRPDLSQAVAAFDKMWQVALEKGVLTVGNDPQQVQQGIGEPDLVTSEGDTTVWQYGYMSVNFEAERLSSVMDLRGIDGFKPASAVPALDLDEQQWQLSQHQISNQSHKREYRPTDAEDDGNTGLFTVERLIGLNQRMSAHTLMDNMHTSLQRQFPDVQWQVIKEGDNDVLFEWRLKQQQQPQQHELVRLIGGDQDIHRLAYTAKDIGDRDAWIKRLGAATLETVGQ